MLQPLTCISGLSAFICVSERDIKGKKGVNCSDRRKSTKIGIDDAKKVLIDFRYSAKLKFSPGGRDMEKSKMAA